MLGWGDSLGRTPAGVNPIGLSVGLHADYRLLQHWLLGARVSYGAGSSADLTAGELRIRSWLVAAELARAWSLGVLSLEPGLALGVQVRHAKGPSAVTTTPVQPDVQSSTRAGLYVSPGVQLTLPLAALQRQLDPFYAGAEARFDLVFGSRVSTRVQLLVHLGIQL